MANIELLNKLRKYPVFGVAEVEKSIKKSRVYARIVIHRLKTKGLITEIEKNKYALEDDVLVIASRILWPSYISCWSALRYYNLTEQLPQVTEVLTTTKRNKKNILFKNTRIVFIQIKPKYFFGFNRIQYNNFEIFMAEPEKALLDAALLKKISFSELADIIKNHSNELDFKKMIKYLLVINNKSIIKRFGYLMETLQLANAAHLKKFRKFMDHNFISLDYAIPKESENSRKIDTWRIVVNTK